MNFWLAYFKLRIPYSNPRLPLTTDFNEIVVYLIAPLDQRRLHVRLQLTGHQQGEHQKDVYRWVCTQTERIARERDN